MHSSGGEKQGRTRAETWRVGLWVVAIGPLVVVGAYFAGSLWLNHFLNGGELCRIISRKTGVILNADRGGYLPLSWRGLSVRSGGLIVKGKPGAGLTEMCATDLRASCSLAGLVRRRWTINQLQAAHLQAAYGAAAARLIHEDLPQAPPLEPAIDTPSPLKVEILETLVARADVFWGDEEKSVGGLRSVAAKFYPRDKDLDVTAGDGTFRQTGWPEFKVSRLDLHYAKPKLQVRTGDFTLGDGRLAITGDFDFGEAHRMALQIHSTHSPVARYLTGTWIGKADGILDGHATVEKKLLAGGQTKAIGSLRISRGALHGWQTLDKIAAVTRRPEFHRLPVSELTAEYAWDGKRLEVTKLRGESRGLVCVEGKFHLEAGSIEATFQVGASQSVLEAIPGAREEVFTVAHDGYFWTTMHLSGPISHPREDLKARLVTAAEKHVAKGLIGVLFKPGSAVTDLLKTIYE